MAKRTRETEMKTFPLEGGGGSWKATVRTSW